MRILSRFAILSRDERALLFRAFPMVVAVRAALWLCPIQAVQRALRKSARPSRQSLPVATIVWAVMAVSRRVPGATCLTQALVAQALLTRYGHDSRIELGVQKAISDRFQAHAWVTCGGRVVLGGHEVGGYTPLAAWKTEL